MHEFAKKVLDASFGVTRLFSVGQAGFIIKSKTGRLLGIDLYLSDCVERVEGSKGFKRLLPKILNPNELVFDVIIATHSHKDHFDDDSIPFFLSQSKTKLFSSEGCKKDVKKLKISSENIVYVHPGDEYEISGFELSFIKCDHGVASPDAVGVVIRVDRKTVLFIGDTCLRLDWIDLYSIYAPIDVLIAPINGMNGNTNSKECALLANMLNPKIVIPCHYGMFASHMGSPGEFYDIMTTCYPKNRFVIMCQGEGIEV